MRGAGSLLVAVGSGIEGQVAVVRGCCIRFGVVVEYCCGAHY